MPKGLALLRNLCQAGNITFSGAWCPAWPWVPNVAWAAALK